MDKVYLVMGGWDYEGSNVIYVASTKEGADEWVSHWEFNPYPEDRKRWRREDFPAGYDFIEIKEMPIDSEDVSQH